jgi:hypothetical protein
MIKLAKIVLVIQFVVCFLIPPLFMNAAFQAGAYAHRSKAFVRALEGSGDQFTSEASRLEFAREIAEFFDEYRVLVPVVIVVLPLLLAISGVSGFVALRRAQVAEGA